MTAHVEGRFETSSSVAPSPLKVLVVNKDRYVKGHLMNRRKGGVPSRGTLMTDEGPSKLESQRRPLTLPCPSHMFVRRLHHVF